MKNRKSILCLDFDGVIHSYSSGWKGARNIPDPPVGGALEFINDALKDFRVSIFSSRSGRWGGRRAMKDWLTKHFVAICPNEEDFPAAPSWWRSRFISSSFMDPWKDELDYAASVFVKEIEWPIFKPPATVSLDDRSITFVGIWPSVETLKNFKPWNK